MPFKNPIQNLLFVEQQLYIQRLNRGDFVGDVMDLRDNLDSFHSSSFQPQKLYFMKYSMYVEASRSYFQRICLNLPLSVNGRMSECQGGNRPE